MDELGKARHRGLTRALLEPAVLRALTEAGPTGLTKPEIVAAIGNTSAVSVQRALVRLRGHDAQIECSGVDRRWRLAAPFAMPLEIPEAEDVVAVLLARAILRPFADADLVARLDRIAEQLDDRLRRREGSGSASPPVSLSSTLTLGTVVEPGVLRGLLLACRRKAVRIRYESPWKDPEHGRQTYEVEPWALRVHDGAVYLRAWRRDRGGARTFRVAQIDALEEIALGDDERLARVPPVPLVWGDEDPAFGIDRDRPDVAVLQFHGAVARWVYRVQWHPSQVDHWVEPGEVLERRLAYRSCRELARRIASVFDGVGTIEPAALRHEVQTIVTGMQNALPGVIARVPAQRATEPEVARTQRRRTRG